MSKKNKNRKGEEVEPEDGYSPEKYYVVDHTALTHAEDVFEKLRQGGRNCIIIPFATWIELDKQKEGQAHKNHIARNVMRCVKEYQKKQDSSVMLMPYDFSHVPGLDKNENDHRIIATAMLARKKFGDKKPVILVCNNINIQVLARHFRLTVEDVKSDRVKIDPTFESMAELNVSKDIIHDLEFPYNPQDEKQKIIPENGGVVCYSDFYGGWQKSFVAIRKGNRFKIVDPTKINLFGIAPKSNNGEINWAQHYAMAVLKDDSISLVALSGGAGTAKTFLAVLAGFDQRHKYEQIQIGRMPIGLGNKDRLGFSPGDIEEKLHPWLLPIYDNIDVIKSCTGERKTVDECLLKRKIEILDLDKVRGRTIPKRYMVIDEIQNLQPEEVLAIVTRPGEGTKVVVTGDFSLKQIDTPTLDEESNGLSVLIKVMRGSKMFAVVHLTQAIRSPLVQEILNRWNGHGN